MFGRNYPFCPLSIPGRAHLAPACNRNAGIIKVNAYPTRRYPNRQFNSLEEATGSSSEPRACFALITLPLAAGIRVGGGRAAARRDTSAMATADSTPGELRREVSR